MDLDAATAPAATPKVHEVKPDFSKPPAQPQDSPGFAETGMSPEKKAHLKAQKKTENCVCVVS